MELTQTNPYSLVPDQFRVEFEKRVMWRYMQELRVNGSGWISSNYDAFDRMTDDVEQLTSFHVFGNPKMYARGMTAFEAEEFSSFIADNHWQFTHDILKAMDAYKLVYYMDFNNKLYNAPLKEIW